MGADATSRQAESLAERGLGAMSVGSGVGGARTALLGTGVAYGDGWGQMGRREVLALRCLWDGQGKCSETIVLEGLVSVKHLGFTP